MFRIFVIRDYDIRVYFTAPSLNSLKRKKINTFIDLTYFSDLNNVCTLRSLRSLYCKPFYVCIYFLAVVTLRVY